MKTYIRLPVSHLKLSGLFFESPKIIFVIALFCQPLGIFHSQPFQQRFGFAGSPIPVQESLNKIRCQQPKYYPVL